MRGPVVKGLDAVRHHAKVQIMQPDFELTDTEASSSGGLGMTRDMPSSLRENLIRLRNARGFSQTELARRAKVPQSTVSRMESGSYAGGRWATIEAIAKALDVDAAELAGDQSSKPKVSAASQPLAVGRTRAADLLQIYLASEWVERDQPTPEELRWLATLGWVTWTGAPPTAETVSVLIGERRKGNL